MNIAIVQAPQMVTMTNYLTTVAIPPLGLAYITAALDRAGHRVSFVDGVGEDLARFSPFGEYFLRGLPHEEVIARIPTDVEVIGIGCMFTPQWPSVRSLVERVRKAFPNAKIILGGEHASALPEHVLATSDVDYVVFGEGEETAVALVGALRDGQPIGAMPGVAYRSDGRIVQNPPRARIKTIDDIAGPAWQMVPVEKYIEYNQPHGAALGRSMPMLATRGCPYRCSYCSSPQMWTTKWIARDVKTLVDELEGYVRTYGANDFHFEDLTAIVRRDWIIDFCKELVDRGLGEKITWQLPSGTRSEAIDLEVMQWMKRAGARNLSYAPESGSKAILKVIRKKVNLDHLMEAARAAVRVGLTLQANFVIGHYEERLSDILRTYRFLVRCAWAGFTDVSLACFYPLPNTEDWRKLETRGTLPPISDELFLKIFQGTDPLRPISWNPRFSDAQMRFLILLGYSIFFGSSWLFRPWRFFRFAYHLATGQATSKSERVLRDSFRKLGTLKKPVGLPALPTSAPLP